MQRLLDLGMIDNAFKKFSEQKVVSLEPSENDPNLILNVIFCVNTDYTLNRITIFISILLQYFGDLKIIVFGVSLNLCFKLDIKLSFKVIVNLNLYLCMLVDDFFDYEKQIVTI